MRAKLGWLSDQAHVILTLCSVIKCCGSLIGCVSALWNSAGEFALLLLFATSSFPGPIISFQRINDANYVNFSYSLMFFWCVPCLQVVRILEMTETHAKMFYKLFSQIDVDFSGDVDIWVS